MDTVPQEWRDKVAGTLIDPDTLLATDYLNHFNEVVMLIGMLPDVPDMLPDCETWQLRTYPEHFLASGLDYGALAAEAYAHTPASIKDPFELTVAQLQAAIPFTVSRCKACIDANDTEGLQRAAATGTDVIRKLIELLGGMIAGGRETMAQNEIDSILGGV